MEKENLPALAMLSQLESISDSVTKKGLNK